MEIRSWLKNLLWTANYQDVSEKQLLEFTLLMTIAQLPLQIEDEPTLNVKNVLNSLVHLWKRGQLIENVLDERELPKSEELADPTIVLLGQVSTWEQGGIKNVKSEWIDATHFFSYSNEIIKNLDGGQNWHWNRKLMIEGLADVYKNGGNNYGFLENKRCLIRPMMYVSRLDGEPKTCLADMTDMVLSFESVAFLDAWIARSGFTNGIAKEKMPFWMQLLSTCAVLNDHHQIAISDLMVLLCWNWNDEKLNCKWNEAFWTLLKEQRHHVAIQMILKDDLNLLQSKVLDFLFNFFGWNAEQIKSNDTNYVWYDQFSKCWYTIDHSFIKNWTKLNVCQKMSFKIPVFKVSAAVTVGLPFEMHLKISDIVMLFKTADLSKLDNFDKTSELLNTVYAMQKSGWEINRRFNDEQEKFQNVFMHEFILEYNQREYHWIRMQIAELLDIIETLLKILNKRNQL